MNDKPKRGGRRPNQTGRPPSANPVNRTRPFYLYEKDVEEIDARNLPTSFVRDAVREKLESLNTNPPASPAPS